MESFFFNKNYQITENDNFKRVDISNGVVFLDIRTQAKLKMKNLDRMVILTITKNGSLAISGNISKNSKSNIYCTSRQDFTISASGEVFILFIADFFLKRYLSSNKNEPIDYLYQKIQEELTCELIDTQPVDALSLYIIDKIIKPNTSINSIKCEHYVLEFLIHRLSLLDIIDPTISKDELEIAQRAKNNLLKNFANPPTISELAHLCATNESKLKITFKKVYKTTIYSYIQKRRLEVANLLLKEQVLTIGEISKKVGYRHQGHFSKLFFQNFGVYPKDLLKR